MVHLRISILKGCTLQYITLKTGFCFKKYVVQHIFFYRASDMLMETPKLELEVGNAEDETRGVFI